MLLSHMAVSVNWAHFIAGVPIIIRALLGGLFEGPCFFWKLPNCQKPGPCIMVQIVMQVYQRSPVMGAIILGPLPSVTDDMRATLRMDIAFFGVTIVRSQQGRV